MPFVPDFQATAATCKSYQEEGKFRTLKPQGPMNATDQQKCDGYFFMTKQTRPGTPEWAAAHPGKLGGRRRRGTRKGRKGGKSRKSRRNRN